MSTIAQYLLLAVVLVVFLWLWLWLLRWRVTRAQRQVVEAFRRHGALSPKSALPLEELGVARRRTIGMRNFQASAFRAMLSAGIVVPVDRDRFYFSEEAVQAAIAAQQSGK
ncbi:MAG: hypothetical protein V3U31_06560 [Dehalococcoidia bacterium]